MLVGAADEVSLTMDTVLLSEADEDVSITTLEVVVALTVMLRLGEPVGAWSSMQSQGSVP